MRDPLRGLLLRVADVLRGLLPRELDEPPERLLWAPDLREPVLREPVLRELEALRDRPPDWLLREPDPLLREPERLLEPDRLLELDRPLARERVRVLERERLVERRRRPVVDARRGRGISARTTSLTSRASSASRNFAMRSSSRLIAFASCAVSRSPTSSASVWMRE